MSHRAAFARLVLFLFALAAAARASAASWDDFDAFVQAEMAAKQAPGLALAVVRDGKVLYSRTYGYRDLENKLPVTPQTLFRIGSVTKSFTAASAGILVQRGKLEWDQPVRNYLPDLRLQDVMATERMTARDMLTHRSGLPRHDMVWFHEDLPRREYVRRLRYLEPSTDFRTRFQYNNLIYTTAGYLVGEVAGKPWEEFIRQEIFTPLRMTSTSATLASFKAAPDHSFGYGDGDTGGIIRVTDTSVDAIAPAGALHSSLEDMTRYLQMFLNDGKASDGRQILEPTILQEMQTPLAYVPVKPEHVEIGAVHYGLGLFVSSYRGHRHVYHSGAYEGFNASIAWLPDQKIGVVLLVNRNLLMNFINVITYRVYDRLLGLPPIDWRARFGPVEPGGRPPGRKDTAQAQIEAARNLKPSRPLADYVGTYEHPAYGNVDVALAGKSLVLRFHGDEFPLLPFRHDVFETGHVPNLIHQIENVRVVFNSSQAGDIESLNIPMERGIKPALLTRKMTKATE